MHPPEIDSRTPVSPDELLQVLNNAASQNSTLVQTSSTQLASLIEKHTDVLDGMHYIATQRDMPLHIRQQSIIQFRNLGSSHWRSKKWGSPSYYSLCCSLNKWNHQVILRWSQTENTQQKLDIIEWSRWSCMWTSPWKLVAVTDTIILRSLGTMLL